MFFPPAHPNDDARLTSVRNIRETSVLHKECQDSVTTDRWVRVALSTATARWVIMCVTRSRPSADITVTLDMPSLISITVWYSGPICFITTMCYKLIAYLVVSDNKDMNSSGIIWVALLSIQVYTQCNLCDNAQWSLIA